MSIATTAAVDPYKDLTEDQKARVEKALAKAKANSDAEAQADNDSHISEPVDIDAEAVAMVADTAQHITSGGSVPGTDVEPVIDGELVDLDQVDAERLDRELRSQVTDYTRRYDELRKLLDEARRKEIHKRRSHRR
jgi:hypothetical protein